MQTIRKIYNKMPHRIIMPKELWEKKVELILVQLNEEKPKIDIRKFFGILPDFNEISDELEFENRDVL